MCARHKNHLQVEYSIFLFALSTMGDLRLSSFLLWSGLILKFMLLYYNFRILCSEYFSLRTVKPTYFILLCSQQASPGLFYHFVLYIMYSFILLVYCLVWHHLAFVCFLHETIFFTVCSFSYFHLLFCRTIVYFIFLFLREENFCFNYCSFSSSKAKLPLQKL